MQLESITIEGFRSIEYIEEIKITSPTLITGHNDAGKSSILDSIKFLLSDYTAVKTDITFASDIDSTHQNENDRLQKTCVTGLFTLSKDEQQNLELPSNVYLRKSLDKNETNSKIEILKVLPKNKLLYSFSSKNTVNELQEIIRALEISINGSRKQDLLTALAEEAANAEKEETWVEAPMAVKKSMPKVYFFGGTKPTNAEVDIRAALQINYDLHMNEEKLQGTLKEIETNLQEKISIEASDIMNHIMSRCGDIGTVSINPEINFSSGLKSTSINIMAREGEIIPLSASGLGKARRISLAVWEYTNGLFKDSPNQDVVVLYDEPDTHLDYLHQRNFMKIIADQCRLSNLKVVLTTHSVNLIDGVNLEDILNIKHKNNRTVIDRLVGNSDNGTYLSNISKSLGLRNTTLLHEKLFVGVEGETEHKAFPVLFKAYQGIQPEALGIAFWDCGGNTGALNFAAFLHKNERAVHFVVDNDSSPSIINENKISKIGLSRGHLSFLGTLEFEDSFSNRIWSKVANQEWPKTSGELWSEEEIETIRKNKKFSSALLEEFKTKSKIAPDGKPHMALVLAANIHTPEDIPDELKNLFDNLIRLIPN